MIIRPIRLNASHRNRRRTRYQWRSRRSEMMFLRHLAIRDGGCRKPMKVQLWRIARMDVMRTGKLEDMKK